MTLCAKALVRSSAVCPIAAALALLLLGAGCGWGDPSGESERFYEEETDLPQIVLRRIDVPDRRLTYTSADLLNPEAGRDAVVLQSTHNLGDGRTMRIQPSTGTVEIIELPGASGSWSVVATGDGTVFIGSHLEGALYRVDPGDTEATRFDLPNPESWVFSLAQTPEGEIYLGTYPEGEVFHFDRDQDRLTSLGPAVDAPERALYVRSLTADFPGRLYAGMGALADVIEIDLETGERQSILPAAYRDRSFAYYVDRVGDYLAVIVTPDDRLLLFDPESGRLVREVAVPDSDGLWSANTHSVVDYDGNLYFASRTNDNLWAYDAESDDLRLVGEGLGGPIGIAGEHVLFTRNQFGVYHIVDLETEEIVVERESRFEGAGMEIHALAPGADGRVLGGIYINQGFFWYDPAIDSLFAPGAAVPFGGQIDQLAALGGLVYLAHYTHARLSVYDPARVWQPGTDPDSNPRVIGSAGNQQDRFPTVVPGSDGKLYMGSIPEYGMLGGALVVYDPETDRMTTHRNVVNDQSVLSLVEADGVLYGGTAVTGGLGSLPTMTDARLFAWDLAAGRKLWDRVIVPGARTSWGLDRLPDGRLIGSADSTLFIYNPRTDSVEMRRPAMPEPITRLVATDTGWIYGLTEERFFRVSPNLIDIEQIDRSSGYWDSLAETTDGRLFVGRGATLFEVVVRSSPADAGEP